MAAIAIFGIGQLWAAHHLTDYLANSPSGLSDGIRWLVLVLVTFMVIGELYAAVSSTQGR